MEEILNCIRKELRKNSDEKTKLSFNRFFKNEVKFYGVNSKIGAKIGKENFEKIKEWSKKKIFLITKEMFASGYCEEAWMAAGWLAKISEKFEVEDIKFLEKLVEEYVDDWAKCDTLCNHAIADYMEMYPQNINYLIKWANSKKLYVRRAAAVTLIIPARKGCFEKEIFAIADILLQDKEDLVQKGCGWMLKAFSEYNPKKVFDYVVKNRKTMSRTALRYAIEKLSTEERITAMRK